MSTGIALSTTLLYTRMSAKIGYRVTNFVEGRDDVFIYGMRWVFIVAASICIVGSLLTFYRMHRYSKDKKDTNSDDTVNTINKKSGDCLS